MGCLPKTPLGKTSLQVFLAFLFFASVFAMFVLLGERGGRHFFSNLKLAIPFSLAVLSAISSLCFGAASIIKQKEKSLFVYLASIIGLAVLLWSLAEIIFPH